MARKFYTLCPCEDVYTCSVKRRPKRIGVQCLTPLTVRLRVTMSTVIGVRKRAWLNELVSFNGRVSGNRNLVFAERKAIRFVDCCRVCLALGILIALRSACFERNAETSSANYRRKKPVDSLPSKFLLQPGSQANSLCLLDRSKQQNEAREACYTRSGTIKGAR